MLGTDAASDAITHFIGLFELADLRARLRLDYDELAATRTHFETGEVATLDATIPAPYAIRDIVAQVRYMPPDPPPLGVENGAPYEYIPIPLQAYGPQLSVTAPAMQFEGLSHGAPQMIMNLTMPAPGSVAVVVVQHLWLSDEDMIGTDGMDYLSLDTLSDTLDALVALAEDAGVPADLVLPASEAGFMPMALALQQAAAAVEDPTAAGAKAHGTHLDGVAGAERPDLDDLLPAAVQERAERDDDDEGPTHEVVHGGNTLVNDVTLTASWISAPVMVVSGASCSVDLISQVNVWQDADSIGGLASGAWTCDDGLTNAVNYASLTHKSFPVPPIPGESDPPAVWAVTTIEGSLLNFNWVEQRNFVSDGDVTSITLTGAKTTMILGGNESVNAVNLFELGFQFDLIIVDGNVVNLAAIFQTNVLLDSDSVSVGGGGGKVSTGDNLLVNDASILQVGQGSHLNASGDYLKLLQDGPGKAGGVLDDPAFAGIDVLRVLHVKGDLVSAQIIKQLNILGDADQVDLLAERAMENAGDVSVVTGSNVLVNSAHIAEYGVDSTIHTRGGVYSDALIHQAELVDTGSPFTSPGLASEAVVFLADGMTGAAAGHDDVTAHVAALDMTPADPMQTVLT